jgi:hypothetical protein
LFYRTLKNINSHHYGSKLRVVASVREQVYSSILESGNANKFKNDEHIVVLNWNYKSIVYFFEEKISKLDDCYFIIEGNEKNIHNWFGLDIIHNKKRNIDENILEYIIRHTGISPRDIVLVGNELARLKSDIRGDIGLIECYIRDTVSKSARTIGQAVFAYCISLFSEKFSKPYEKYGDEFNKKSEAVKELFRDSNKDCLSWQDIESIMLKINKEFDNKSKSQELFDLLWRNGGIGYLEYSSNDIEEEYFYRDSNFEHFNLPRHKDKYVISSCLKEYLEIKAISTSKPILGGRR